MRRDLVEAEAEVDALVLKHGRISSEGGARFVTARARPVPSKIKPSTL